MRIMRVSHSEEAAVLVKRVDAFMRDHIYPNEPLFRRQVTDARPGQPPGVVEELKARARSTGLWNLFLSDTRYGPGLTHRQYAPIAEIMGRSPGFAPEVFNCSAPDAANMELLARYGTDEQKRRWLQPLLAGEIRSCFAMSEPDVASSDATNISATIVRSGHEYVVNGRKWFVSGAGDPRCRLAIVMGRTSVDGPSHRQQSMVLVPMEARGVTVVRTLPVFGYDASPNRHAEMTFADVRVAASSRLGDEGSGFELAQARLGPGRVHHCMRLIGMAERAMELMCARVKQRTAFAKPLADQGTIRADIAESRVAIEQARLLVLRAAEIMDDAGPKAARREIAMIKIVAPRMALDVLDRAIQAHGAAGLSADFPLALAWAHARALRIADGPDEVHRETIAKLELADASRR
jgi:acyl-CoA dehydrogenase